MAKSEVRPVSGSGRPGGQSSGLLVTAPAERIDALHVLPREAQRRQFVLIGHAFFERQRQRRAHCGLGGLHRQRLEAGQPRADLKCPRQSCTDPGHLLHEPKSQGFCSGDVLTRQQHAHRLAIADQTGQQLGSTAAWNPAVLHLWKAES